MSKKHLKKESQKHHINDSVNHHLKTLLLLVILLISLVSHLQAQIITDSIKVDGNYRTFHFNKPQGLKDSGRLIFVLHGSGGRGVDMMRSTLKLEEKASEDNLLIVYPDGYKNYWNECRKAANSKANLENIDENTFFREMIQRFKEKYKINEKEVFAIGTSGGGHMAYKLAMTMPHHVRAITALIANLPDTNNLDCPESKVPVSVMIVIGLKIRRIHMKEV